MTSAIGFIVGFALFGAVIYLPLYLQIVKGYSPTGSGLLLTPLMAGVLVTLDRQRAADQPLGRYKPFPDRRHGADDARDVPALRHRRLGADLADRALHGRARLRARHDDAGARARRPERRPVRAARRRHLRLDALPAGRRLDRGVALRRDLREPARRQPRARAPGRRAPVQPPRARRASTQLPACGARVLPRGVRRVAAAGVRCGGGDLVARLPAHVAPARRCRSAGAPPPTASPRSTRCRARRSRSPSSSGSSPRSRSARTAGASTTTSPSGPVSISTLPSCGCSRGSGKVPRSTSPTRRLTAAGDSLRGRGLLENGHLAE